MKKEKYIKPKTQQELFDYIDVLTSSSSEEDDSDPADNNVPWGE